MLQTSNVQITPQMLVLVAEIDEFKGAWRALGTLAPERLSALRRVATIESIGSSTRIEGSRLSDREVEQLLSNLEIQSLGSRDEQEVAGYAEVMETVFASWPDIRVTENHIKQLHRDLLRFSDKDERHRGEYKTTSNSVAAFDVNGNQGRLREKVERERLLLAKLPGLAVQILDHARDHGRITIADAVAVTGASRNTLKGHFKSLCESKLLGLHGRGRGVWYSLP